MSVSNGNKIEKLQWVVKHQGSFKDEIDFLETILVENGIKQENISKFLNPTKDCLNDPFLLNNMDKAVELVHDVVKKDRKIFVKVDVDADGYTSASVLIQFLQAVNSNIKIEYQLDYEKRHGLKFENLTEYKNDEFDLIIIPDASMTCADAKQIINNYSAKILVLDHHLVETEYLNNKTGKWINKEEADKLKVKFPDRITEDNYTNYCIAVNCHDGNYPNKNLSGVGVVQKFIEAYIQKYGKEDNIESVIINNEYVDPTTYFYDLVSTGMIADSILALDFETRYYMLSGIKQENYHNNLLTEIVNRNEDNFKFGRTIENVGWNLAPLINGVIRFGKPEEQEEVFKAILNIKEDIEYQPRRASKNDPKPDIELHSLQWDAARICGNVKSRQDTEVRKYIKQIETEIESKDLLKNSVLFVDGTKVLEKGTVSGLVANKLASKYFRPVVMMRERDAHEWGGSVRGYDKGPIPSIKDFLNECGAEVRGHSNAGGWFCSKDKLNDVIKKCNELMPVENLCTIHQVDWEIPANKLKRAYVQEVAENYAVFGNGIPTPMFVITDLHITANQINGYGENNGFIRFVYNGVTFVKKYCPIGDYDKMTMRDRKTFGVNKKPLVLNIIGQFVLNAWEDKINPEVKILFYDVKEDKDNEIDDFIGEIKNEKKNVNKNVNKIKKDTKTATKEEEYNDTQPKEEQKIDEINKVENSEKIENQKKEEKVEKEKIKGKEIKKVTIDDDFDF